MDSMNKCDKNVWNLGSKIVLLQWTDWQFVLAWNSLSDWSVAAWWQKKNSKINPCLNRKCGFFFYYYYCFLSVFILENIFLGLAWNSLGWLFSSSAQWRNALSQHIRKCEEKMVTRCLLKKRTERHWMEKRERESFECSGGGGDLCVHEVESFSGFKAPEQLLGWPKKEQNREAKLSCNVEVMLKEKLLWKTKKINK